MQDPRGLSGADGRRVLECSSRGDRRFSALYARVKIFGREASIEEHYQLAKRFPRAPRTWREAKGRRPAHLEICGRVLPPEYLTAWYALLWLVYLDAHPELVAYAREFDEFADSFARPGANSQADMVRLYAKQGRRALVKRCAPLLRALGAAPRWGTIDTLFRAGELSLQERRLIADQAYRLLEYAKTKRRRPE